MNCGTCGTVCGNPPFATTVSCTNGACTSTCAEMHADCDGMFKTGCETLIAFNINNCGGCGKVCKPVPNGVQWCFEGSCRIEKCATNFKDCNGDYMDGCEANLGTNEKHCGGCNNACAPGKTCKNGRCR